MLYFNANTRGNHPAPAKRAAPADAEHRDGWRRFWFGLKQEDRQLLREIMESDKCPGIEIEPGVYSGCEPGAGDCPTCGK